MLIVGKFSYKKWLNYCKPIIYNDRHIRSDGHFHTKEITLKLSQLTLFDGVVSKSKIIDLSLSSSGLCCRFWRRPLRRVGMLSDLIIDTRVDLRLPRPDCDITYKWRWTEEMEMKINENVWKTSQMSFYLAWTFWSATFVWFVNQMLEWCVHDFLLRKI